MHTLRAISASAGSGKTTSLCKTLSERVAQGLDPARVLATTYTRKAAAEIKGRILATILSHPSLDAQAKLEKAERIELAAIGTVHSVGYQLIQRYAVQLGVSPSLRVLDENVSTYVMSQVMATMDQAPWQKLAQLAGAFELEKPNELALRLVVLKRGNRIGNAAFRAQMRASMERLLEVMAPKGPRKSDGGFSKFYKAVKDALDKLEGIEDSTARTQGAIKKLRHILNLHGEQWPIFLQAIKIEAGKRSGAEKCLEELRTVAAKVRSEPALHLQIREFTELLVKQVLNLEEAYQAFKEEHGQVDFTDIEVTFLELLSNPFHQASLRRDFDLVLVDEFQDTNPIQLGIFQELRSLARETQWVGDPKQSIYGFRGTDSLLVQEVWSTIPESDKERLPKNYRSQAGLVQLVGSLFKPVLGDDVLQEHERAGAERGIERWIIDSTNAESFHLSVAAGVAELQKEGIALRDIAILARTNDHLRKQGEALKQLGIPSLLELPGLLCTREGALVFNGLKWMIDASNSTAGATILHILSDPSEQCPLWLEERIRAIRNGSSKTGPGTAGNWLLPNKGGDAHPVLKQLRSLARTLLPPSIAVQRVIELADTSTYMREWGNTAARAANLESFISLAVSYENEAEVLGLAATLRGFINWLEKLAEKGNDSRHPPYGLDAVSLLTYHGAKGLEWPVVILTGLDFARDPDLWSPIVVGGDPGSDDPLAGREIHFWLWPFGRNKYNNNVLQGTHLETDALASREGKEAEVRHRHETIRLLYVGFTRARDKLVLAHKRKKGTAWLDMLPGAAETLDPTLPPGEYPLEDIETTYVVRHPGNSDAESARHEPQGSETWLKALEPVSKAPASPGPRRYSPSEQEESVPATVCIETLGAAAVHPTGIKEDEWSLLGNAVHAYLAGTWSYEDLRVSQRKKIAERCLRAHAAAFIKPAELVEIGERFAQWLRNSYPSARPHTEVAIIAPRKDGGQWRGVIDLLLELPGNEVVVIDHKTVDLTSGECEEKALEYAGQVAAYQEALRGQGLRVTASWIHFPLARALVRLNIT